MDILIDDQLIDSSYFGTTEDFYWELDMKNGVLTRTLYSHYLIKQSSSFLRAFFKHCQK